MSTRSYIGIQKNGKIKAIYCHFDGYLDGVGQTLYKHYKDKQKINKLIDLGDISVLDEEVDIPEGCNHSFDNQAVGITVAYGRDRGETNIQAKQFENEEDFLTKCKKSWIEYVYLYKNDSWYYCQLYNSKEFKPMKDLNNVQ